MKFNDAGGGGGTGVWTHQRFDLVEDVRSVHLLVGEDGHLEQDPFLVCVIEKKIVFKRV